MTRANSSAGAFGALSIAAVVGSLLRAVPIAFGRRELRSTMLWTLVLSGVLFAACVVGLIAAAVGLSNWVADPGWFVQLLVGTVAFVLAWLFAPVLFQLVGGVALAVLQERLFLGARSVAGAAAQEGTTSAVALIMRSLSVEARRFGRLIGLSVLLLPLNLIPGLGSALYLGLTFLLSAHTLAWDLLSGHFEVHGVPYAEQKACLRANRTKTLAFGSVALALSLIPVVQVVFLATNVVGAGLLSAAIDVADAE